MPRTVKRGPLQEREPELVIEKHKPVNPKDHVVVDRKGQRWFVAGWSNRWTKLG